MAGRSPRRAAPPHLLEEYREQTPAVERWLFEEVCVEDARSLDEVRWVIEHAAGDPAFGGVTAQALLERGRAVRDELDELAATGWLRGVRRVIQFQPDPEFALRAGFIEGVRLLGEYGVPFDIGTDRGRLATIIRFVRQCPDVQFVLNHIGKPNIADGEWEPWASRIRDFAAMPNVVCKVSGLLTECGPKGDAAGVRPYFEHAAEQFGFSRLLYGSDWPVQETAGGIRRQLAVLDELMAGTSPDEQADLWARTARRVYHLT